MKLKDFPELRIFAILGIITLAWYLLSIFGSFLAIFADIFLLLVLSWILAFILEPLVEGVCHLGLKRVWAAALIYFFFALATVVLIWVILPATVIQFTQLASLVPRYLPENSLVSAKIADFLANTASNSLYFVSSLASLATGLFLVFILSFYFLISRAEISKFFLDLIPNEYEDDYKFLERTVNNTFASFLRVQVFLGLVLGLVAFIFLSILQVHFALSASIASAILAMIPVVGPVIFLLPPILAALTISVEKLIIVVAVLTLAAQLVYNLLAPKLLGSALKIHPIIVLLSFLVGYKIAGVWGAVFAVPITSALFIIAKELLKYWKQEADK